MKRWILCSTRYEGVYEVTGYEVVYEVTRYEGVYEVTGYEVVYEITSYEGVYEVTRYRDFAALMPAR